MSKEGEGAGPLHVAASATALPQSSNGVPMEATPASASSGVLAKKVSIQPTASGFLSLPREVQVSILKRVEEAAEAAKGAEEAEEDGSGGGINSLLPLRLVSRAFRDAVDHCMTKFTCHINKSTKERDNDLLARLGHCFQHVLLRWPGIHDLSLRFKWKVEYFDYVLAAAAGSCRGLKTLRLTPDLICRNWPMKESDKPCLSVIGQWTALQSLYIQGANEIGDIYKGLSVLSSLRGLEELVLVDTRLKKLGALPALTALTLEERWVEGWPSKDDDGVDLANLPLSTKLVRLTLEGVYVDSLLLPPSLTELSIDLVTTEDRFRHPVPLANLTSLSLKLLACDSAPWLSTNSGIQSLTLCDFLAGAIPVPPIGDLTSLTVLDIGVQFEVRGVPRFPPLDRLQLLHTLRLHSLPGIEVIPGLTSLLSLQELDIRKCVDLEIPADLPWQLTRLTTLRLVDIEDLSGPPPPPGSVVGLRELELEDASELELLELSPFQALTSLQVAKMPNLVSLGGLETLTALRRLVISGFRHGKKPDIRVQSFPNLETFVLEGYVVKLR